MNRPADPFEQQRQAMVVNQLQARNIRDQRVLAAMRAIPRHEFVPAEVRDQAYSDGPLPIGQQQTISQPYIVAYMTQLLKLTGHETVLEIGTGSGYQAALLGYLARQVYTLERHPRLAAVAQRRLRALGIDNVEVLVGDGSQGLPDMAPFNAILVTAVAPSVPGPLRGQLAPDGGRLVLPVGNDEGQHLVVVVRHGNRCRIQRAGAVRFVPLIGEHGFKQDETD